ncbi:hypothetical protein [Dietzia alimentaria]|uniref:hypothetical protein n=1 Tax=Dietzia alimentaria TaxID=665550 RepID=UPI00029A61DE|nr:hypothetical protein [Dietzia alimentaria]
MSTIIGVDDLRSSLPGKTETEMQQIADEAEALAAAYAPCLFSPAFDAADPANAHRVASFKAILRRAVAYDSAAGSGAVTTTSVRADAFSKDQQIDTRQRQSGMLFSPLQIDALRALCPPKVRDLGVYSVPLGMPGL